MDRCCNERRVNKGFTLIELLIVVAIIGILAAVGAAVIPGLLENAKKNATKAIHSQVVNYMTIGAQECYSGQASAMNGKLGCNINGGGIRAGGVIMATIDALKGINKNPYDTSKEAVEQGTNYLSGQVSLAAANKSAFPSGTIEIKTCISSTADCTNADNRLFSALPIE